jgi:threonine/homoserine/homoserine lactone efflux protein
MNFDALEKAWSQQTVGGALDAAAVAEQLEHDLRSARRRFRGAIALAAGLLGLSWLVALGGHLSGIKSLTPLELAAHAVGSVFYLLWLVLAVRSARALQREQRAAGGTTRAATEASLRVIDLQVGNYRVAAWSLLLAVTAASSLSALKYRTGELHGVGAVATALFVALLAGIVGAALWHRYRTTLRPRREELRRRLHEMELG